jgi:preprotein translocase subunit SecA
MPLQGASGLPKNIQLLRLIPSSEQTGRPPHSPEAELVQKLKLKSKFNEYTLPNFNNLAPSAPYTDWAYWVIPQGSIQLETEEDSLLTGRILLNSRIFNAKQRVSLMPLDTNHVTTSPSDPYLHESKSNPYAESILKAVQNLSRKEKQELQLLMKVSMLNRSICRVFGFWMSSEGRLHLVCEKSDNNVFKRWNTLRTQTAIRKLSIDIENSSISDLGPKSRWCQFSEAMKFFSKTAMEICEIVVKLHSQGLVCGNLAPECFDFDEFGHPLIDLNRALLDRKKLKQFIRNVLTGTEGSKTEDILSGTMPWLFLSPELLTVLYNDEIGFISADSEKKKCALDSVLETTTPISFKSDMWSLGCLLLMFLIGESPFSDLSFSEFLEGILIERIKIAVWFEEKLLTETLLSTVEVSLDSPYEHFKHLLCKCFEYDPRNRPDALDLWRCLNEGVVSAEEPYKDMACFNPPDEVSCCLVLGESLSSFTAEIESCAEQEAVDGKSGQSNEFVNKLRDLDLSESTVIDAEVTGGNELQMHALKVATLEGHIDCVSALAVCGELLLSASYDKTICIWSLHTNSHLETLRGHQHRILALAIDPKASLCFSGDYGGCIFVWAIESVPRQEPVTTWYEHRDWRYSGVHALAISKSGYLYSGSGDKTIKAWSLQDYSLVSTMEGHKSLVSALFVNEELLYSGSWDGTVRLWWLGDHSPLAVLGDNVPTHLSAVHALTMCNGTLIAVYNNGWLKVWKDDILLKSLQVHNDAIISADAEHDWIFIGSWDKTIKAFNINTILENPTPKVIDCNSVVTSLLLHQGKLFAGFANKAIKVFS